MIKKRYPLSQAMQQLDAIVDELADAQTVELTLSGKTIAVVMSVEKYQQLTEPPRGFWEALTTFRQKHNLKALDVSPEEVWGGGTRDRSSGREVEL